MRTKFFCVKYIFLGIFTMNFFLSVQSMAEKRKETSRHPHFKYTISPPLQIKHFTSVGTILLLLIALRNPKLMSIWPLRATNLCFTFNKTIRRYSKTKIERVRKCLEMILFSHHFHLQPLLPHCLHRQPYQGQIHHFP